jgi:hypothetical protein
MMRFRDSVGNMMTVSDPAPLTEREERNPPPWGHCFFCYQQDGKAHVPVHAVVQTAYDTGERGQAFACEKHSKEAE